jgi:hypothetical protein
MGSALYFCASLSVILLSRAIPDKRDKIFFAETNSFAQINTMRLP